MPSIRPSARRARRSASPTSSSKSIVQRARHIEVQLLGDQHGNLVHLFERDCSVQRRHQKVVEIAPAPNLDDGDAPGILRRGPRRRPGGRLDNAGTVEFLVDTDSGEFYFIEVNPRIQVEHTVTEEVTGFDIVKSQILIAQGKPLVGPRDRPGRSGQDQHARLRAPVPRDDRRPGQQVHSRLRPAQPLPLGQRPGHSPRRRHARSPARSSRRFTIRCWSR